jgi:peptidoglycan L-alanyl-D-glutamate endopeptidase CwlK
VAAVTGYRFSKRSMQLLSRVHPELVAVVVTCLYCYTVLDFAVICGIRTLEQQVELVKRGVSWTLNSKHLIQADGYSHAVDLQPLRYNKAAHDWEAFRELATCMHLSADHLGVKIRWGGAWGDKKRDGYHFELK